jgi:hypothetical protein
VIEPTYFSIELSGRSYAPCRECGETTDTQTRFCDPSAALLPDIDNVVDDGWSTSSRYTVSLRDGRTLALAADGTFWSWLPGPSLATGMDLAPVDLPVMVIAAIIAATS